MRRHCSFFLIFLIISLVLSACVPQITVTPLRPEPPTPALATELPATKPATPAELRVNLSTFPDIIDPQKSSFVNEIAVLKMIYEGLTRLDSNLNTVPAAAESWNYNDDATQLTFHLRDGLTYSDGSLLNAARFEYSFKRNIDPTTAGEYATITNDILGAAEWRSCTENCDDRKKVVDDSVKASHADGSACTGYDDVDCNTFTLKFKQPTPYFHTVAYLWVGYPAKQELIESGGENWWLDPANQLGNGPFIMTDLEQGVSVHLIPNPKYRAGAPSYELDYQFINDSAVALEAYKNNELDVIGLAAEDLATVKADPELSQEFILYPGSCTYAVMFHQQKEPFTDPGVRQAFSYALDREAWVKDVLQGLGYPTLTWIPKGFPGYQEGETRFGYNPEKAKQTLADAGYTVENGQLKKGDKTFEVTDTFSDTPRNRTRNEWLVAKWKEILGIDIKLDPVEPTTYTALTKDINTAPQMFILRWCADYPDPQNWLSVYWKTGAFGERIGFSNPEMDKLMNQADAELDPKKRMELYRQAQDLLVGGGYVAFMWNDVNAYLVKPWVQGVTATAMDADWPGAIVPTSITIADH